MSPMFRRTAMMAALVSLLATGACSSDAGKPATGVNLAVAHPKSPEDDPFGLPDDKFVAVIAEVPGRPDSEFQMVKPYVPGMSLDLQCMSGGTCSGITFGAGQQIRIELWSKNTATNQPDLPVLGRGRSIPFDALSGAAAKTLTPYVTRMNRFAPAVGPGDVTAELPGRAGSATVTLPGNEGYVLVIGGAAPKPGAKNAFDPASYTDFSDAITVYDPNTRAMLPVSQKGPEFALKTPRAFHAVAAGATVIAVVGGYTSSAGGAKPTNSVEYLDRNSRTLTATEGKPDLVFARAGATVVQMFAGSDFFLILGGKGDTPCKDEQGADLDCAANTWELWHPQHGNMAQGRLNEPRWNHASVVIPGGGGGYVMLIGGENDSDALPNFEVLQFSSAGGGVISTKGQACKAGAGLPACEQFYWEPLTQGMPVKRTLPGAAYVSVPRGSGAPQYRFVYLIGGFGDKAHTQALARIDVFNLATGSYVNADGFAMSTGRGAPMVAAVPHPTTQGQVLIAGGSASDTIHLSSAESILVRLDPSSNPPTPVISIPLVGNDLPGGGRSLGQAITLNTGHVMVLGGVGTTADGLVGQGAVTLWNPQY